MSKLAGKTAQVVMGDVVQGGTKLNPARIGGGQGIALAIEVLH